MPAEVRSVRAQLAPQVEELVASFGDPLTQIEFLRLLIAGGIVEPAPVDAETAVRMARPYAWLLDHVGAEGIKLTSAGYLPPANVEAIAAELNLNDEWIGTLNRESQTAPVLEFRESATRLGLLRKYRGRLLLTPRGRGLRADPAALWSYLAQAVPPAGASRLVRHASLLLLGVVAGHASGLAGEDPYAYVARMLSAAGWARRDGTGPDKWEARRAADDTWVVLFRIGALGRDGRGAGPDSPTADGALFARAALRTWPGDGAATG